MKLIIRIFVFTIFLTLLSTTTFGKNLSITNCKTDVYPTRAEIPHLSVCTLPKGTPVEVLKKTQEVDGIWCRIRVHTKDSECTGWVEETILLKQTESERLRLEQHGASSVERKEPKPTTVNYYLSGYYLSENRPSYLNLGNNIVVVIPNETALRIITPGYYRQQQHLEVELYIGKIHYNGWIRNYDIKKNNTAKADRKISAKIREAKKRRLVKIRELEEKVKQLPITYYEGHYGIYNELLALDPKNTKYQQKVVFYERKMAEEEKRIKKKARKQALRRGYVLELLSWHWDHDGDYVIVQGEVQNITDKRLEGIQALVSWYNKDGEFITSDSSLLDYQVLMPGQKSPFKVYTNFNPQMDSVSLGFKYYFGGQVKIIR